MVLHQESQRLHNFCCCRLSHHLLVPAVTTDLPDRIHHAVCVPTRPIDHIIRLQLEEVYIQSYSFYRLADDCPQWSRSDPFRNDYRLTELRRHTNQTPPPRHGTIGFTGLRMCREQSVDDHPSDRSTERPDDFQNAYKLN